MFPAAGSLVASAGAADLSTRDVTAMLFKASRAAPPDLSGKNLSRLDLADLDFKAANLANANLFGADLTRADLVKADLRGARLDRATITAARAWRSATTRPWIAPTSSMVERATTAPRRAIANTAAIAIITTINAKP